MEDVRCQELGEQSWKSLDENDNPTRVWDDEIVR
jgi:hypothetical protein